MPPDRAYRPGGRAFRVRGAASPAQVSSWVRGIYAARARWTHDFDGAQASLGRAFYTHLEQDRAALYFAEAARSDALVEAAAPGLQAHLRAVAASLTGEEVIARAGWCGAGVHVFPAGGWLARHGGDVHFDLEGLTDAQVEDGNEAFTLVLMLQPPERGGALALWDVVAGPGVEEAAPGPPTELVDYEAGEAVMIDSRRLHQIQPFEGARDRVSATLHAVRAKGRWESWF